MEGFWGGVGLFLPEAEQRQGCLFEEPQRMVRCHYKEKPLLLRWCKFCIKFDPTESYCLQNHRVVEVFNWCEKMGVKKD